MLFCTVFTRISVRFCGVRTPPFYILLNITNSEKETFSENMKSSNNNVQNTSQLALHKANRQKIYYQVAEIFVLLLTHV